MGRIIGKGEALDSDEAADGLTSLNAMLDNFQTERMFVHQIVEESFTWTGAQQSRTVGTAGDFATDRPVKVDGSSYFRSVTIDYHITLIDSDAWAAIPDKSTQSTFPMYLYPEYGASLVTIYAYPTPSANLTFLLRSWKRLQSFSALTTDLALPPGHEDLIVFNLAERFGVEFGKEIPEKVQEIAQRTRALMKRVNGITPVMASEVGYISRNKTFNINLG